MRTARDTDPILPTTNMATNGKSKDARKRVLVVGAGAAGEFCCSLCNSVVRLTGSKECRVLTICRNIQTGST